jgi:hypothetical protein
VKTSYCFVEFIFVHNKALAPSRPCSLLPCNLQPYQLNLPLANTTKWSYDAVATAAEHQGLHLCVLIVWTSPARVAVLPLCVRSAGVACCMCLQGLEQNSYENFMLQSPADCSFCFKDCSVFLLAAG